MTDAEAGIRRYTSLLTQGLWPVTTRRPPQTVLIDGEFGEPTHFHPQCVTVRMWDGRTVYLRRWQYPSANAAALADMDAMATYLADLADHTSPARSGP